jgi:hypothetical protein
MILTIQSVTQEALKILNKSFDDAYAKQHRKQLGGNEGIHGLKPPLHNAFSRVDAEDGERSDTEDAAGFTVRYKGTGR